MECQDVKQLLAFANRKRAELDALEREALTQHLETCPACAEAAKAELAFDDAVGPVLRDVPVPADLRRKVLKRLAAERGSVPWKPVLAAAALILIALSAGITWKNWPLPEASMAAVIGVVERTEWDEEKLETYFAKQGVAAHLPRQFDPRYLQHADVTEFEGERVARLTFSRVDQRPAVATVLILSTKQFRKNELWQAKEIPATTWIRIRPDDENSEFTYVIYHRGEFEALLRELN